MTVTFDKTIGYLTPRSETLEISERKPPSICIDTIAILRITLPSRDCGCRYVVPPQHRPQGEYLTLHMCHLTLQSADFARIGCTSAASFSMCMWLYGMLVLQVAGWILVMDCVGLYLRVLRLLHSCPRITWTPDCHGIRSDFLQSRFAVSGVLSRSSVGIFSCPLRRH